MKEHAKERKTNLLGRTLVKEAILILRHGSGEMQSGGSRDRRGHRHRGTRIEVDACGVIQCAGIRVHGNVLGRGRRRVVIEKLVHALQEIFVRLEGAPGRRY